MVEQELLQPRRRTVTKQLLPPAAIITAFPFWEGLEVSGPAKYSLITVISIRKL